MTIFSNVLDMVLYMFVLESRQFDVLGFRGEPSRMEYREHGLVLRQHLSDEVGDPRTSCSLDEMVQQQCGDSMVLKLVRHHESHLGLGPVIKSVVATHGEKRTLLLKYEGHAIHSVNLGEMRNFV